MRKLLPIVLSVVCMVVIAWAIPQQADAVQQNDVTVDCDGRKLMPKDRPRIIRDMVRGFLVPNRDELGNETEKGIGRRAVLENALPDPVPQISQQIPSQESVYLKEIASVLSIPVSDKDTPGDIAFKIRQRLENTERYRGSVLSNESFAKAKSAIRITADAETFAEYHAFIKKVTGKKILVIGE